ncbi:MAG: alpha/beta fold hydrolase [Sphingobacteriaceae bacterium]
MQKSFITSILVYAFISIFCCSLSIAQTKKEKEVLNQLNHKDSIIYKTVNGQNLMITVYQPTKKRFAKTPVALFIHGGGWSGGNRYVVLKNLYYQPLKNLLDSGIACVSVQYRLAKGTSTAIDAVADCKDAGKYIVKHAEEFGFDTRRIGVWGGSAGGHLSLMTGLAPDSRFPGDPVLAKVKVAYKCIVPYYPQTTFTNPEVLSGTRYFSKEKLDKIFGTAMDTRAESAKLLSPVEYINKKNPPVLILYGTADSTLSYKNATYYMSKAKQAGARAELFTVMNGGHGFSGKNVPVTIAEISKRASDFMIAKLLD